MEHEKKARAKSRSVFFTHDSKSTMHQAIIMLDKKKVKKLLSEGETFCRGMEIRLHHAVIGIKYNCFILAQEFGSWSFIKFLISQDPEGALKARSDDGETLLMLFAKKHSVKKVQFMLDIGADPDIRDDYGNTAIMLALTGLYRTCKVEHQRDYGLHDPDVVDDENTVDEETVDVNVNTAGMLNTNARREDRESFVERCHRVINLLIKRGADVNLCNLNGQNALHIAVKKLKGLVFRHILKSLINAGIDPTAEDHHHCTMLSYAMQSFVELCIGCKHDPTKPSVNVKRAYKTMRYLFLLPAFQMNSFQFCCVSKMHPQTILLKHLSRCQVLTGRKAIFLYMIGRHLLNPTLVVEDYLQVGFENIMEVDKWIKFPLGPLALYINNEQYLGSSTSDEELSRLGHKLFENVRCMMSAGFGANLPGTVSPLTIGLLHLNPQFHFVTFAKVMLNSGVHVEQMMLMFTNTLLEKFGAELCLPDALRAAVSQAHLDPTVTLELVKMFMPHFAHPGLTLLCFIHDPRKITRLFWFLSSCGSLQNSAMHWKVKRNILASVRMSQTQLQNFNQMHSGFPSLQALCRNTVRTHLARQAAKQGHSFPEAIRSVPPLATPSQNLLNVSQFLE